MLVVVASRYDEIARSLVDCWAKQGARLLTCEDLSVVGWRHSLRGVGGDSSPLLDSTAVVDAQVVGVEEISGVLIRLPCVFEQELLHIVPDDRAYVAAVDLLAVHFSSHDSNKEMAISSRLTHKG